MLRLSLIYCVWLSGSFLATCPPTDSFELNEWHDATGPWFEATKGEPWPLVQSRELFNVYYIIKADEFQFQIRKETCDTLEDAVLRYKRIISNEFRVADIIFSHKSERNRNPLKPNSLLCNGGYLTGLDIFLNHKCEEYPHIGADESYALNISLKNSNSFASLTADSIWGILRGLETFSQLLTPAINESGLAIQDQNIVDYPNMTHRGLLLDTSRHYLPVADILLTLDTMSYNKLNVFHWHIVDDNSFPYESAMFPELSTKGAYFPTMIYTADDIRKIIEFARRRGIRVLPEFDTPGHTQSWGLSHPELLTTCYDYGGKPTGLLGPINPISPTLYDFMNSLLNEVVHLFPDKYIHLGGDEVLYDCWQSNPDIQSFIKKNNISCCEKFEEIYIRRLLDIASDLKVTPIVWQEVFDNKVQIYKGTLVHVWTGKWKEKLAAVTGAGYPALLSTCWYLDHVAGGGDWLKYFNCEPLAFNSTTEEQKKLVLGGEACMWGEFVDRNNIHSRIWPRASAVAERLWSSVKQDNDTAAARLEEHACRMNKRGVPAQPPNGPGFCVT